MSLKFSQKQLLCVAAGILLAVLSYFTGEEELIRQEENGTLALDRPGYGEEGKEVELIAKGKESEDRITVTVSGRQYGQEEAEQAFEEIVGLLPELLPAEEESLTEVRTDLNFPEELEAYPGIGLAWSSSDPELITEEGEVLNEGRKEAVQAVILLELSAGEYCLEAEIPVTVLPGEEKELSRAEKLTALLGKADTETLTGARLLLPQSLEGEALQFETERDRTWILLPVLGLAAAVLLGLQPKEEEKKKRRERETELLTDYSEIVSKLIVYIGAGLTVRNAWLLLARGGCRKGETPRAVYQEAARSAGELENGVPEGRVYMDFAKRCGLRCYIRMASLLEQNRQTGDTALLSALELEMTEAFEQRKNVAKRLGEEAGTKLMAPLMMSLLAVIVIVIIPAVSQMG